MVNREEHARGAFFEGRFKSVAILDEESLLATCAYIDLNAVAAGLATVPEKSEHTNVDGCATWQDDWAWVVSPTSLAAPRDEPERGLVSRGRSAV
jgi:hypothetical protein